MRILFDQGVPLPLRDALAQHEVRTAFKMGWAELKNGDLLKAAEEEFDLIITTDKNWKYQQQVVGRRIAILVLPTTNWPELKLISNRIVAAIDSAQSGEFLEL